MSVTMQKVDFQIRNTLEKDIPAILALFNAEVAAGRMLPRSKENLTVTLPLWRVATIDEEIIGCVSLVFFNSSLCEIRSLAVAEGYRMIGLGKKLIESAMELAQGYDATTVFALTRAPWVFERLGFKRTLIKKFPEKVWQDCKPCPFINKCDEIAVYFNLKESEILYE